MSILTSKKYKEYDKVSRYQVFPYYYHSVDDKFIYGLTAHLDNKQTAFVAHKVKEFDTLDTLALYYYNNPTYFWIIADYNRIQDPYEELEIGRVLKIPTFSNIAFDI